MTFTIHRDAEKGATEINYGEKLLSVGIAIKRPHCSGTVFLKVIEIFFLNRSLVALQCCVSAVQQGESAIHMHISPLCHHRALSRVPCAIQLVLINYLIYT